MAVVEILSPQDKDQWARSLATAGFVMELQEAIQVTKDNWAAGHYTGETAEQTMMLNVQALSGVAVLQQVLNLIEERKLVAIQPEAYNND